MTLRRYGAGGPQRARVATSCGSPQPAPGAAPVRPGVRDHGADPVDPHRDAEAGPEGPRAPAPVHTARAPYVGAPRARPGCPRGPGVPDGLRFPAAPEGRSSAGATAGSQRRRRPVARAATTRGVDRRMWTGAGGRTRLLPRDLAGETTVGRVAPAGPRVALARATHDRRVAADRGRRPARRGRHAPGTRTAPDICRGPFHDGGWGTWTRTKNDGTRNRCVANYTIPQEAVRPRVPVARGTINYCTASRTSLRPPTRSRWTAEAVRAP